MKMYIEFAVKGLGSVGNTGMQYIGVIPYLPSLGKGAK